MCVGESVNTGQKPTKPKTATFKNRNVNVISAPSSERVYTARLLATFDFFFCSRLNWWQTDVCSRSVFIHWFQGKAFPFHPRGSGAPTELNSVRLPSSARYDSANPWPSALQNRCHVRSTATAESNRGFFSVKAKKQNQHTVVLGLYGV